MKSHKAGDASFEKADGSQFTGNVWINRGISAPEMGGTGLVVVDFEPGARTHWHSHPGGQFLYGVAGRGRVRTRNESQGIVLEPGDVAFVAPGEVHFHGASPAAPLIHVAVNGGGAPDWLEPVTDSEYEEGF